MKCPQCSRENDDGSVFCGKCGANLAQRGPAPDVSEGARTLFVGGGLRSPFAPPVTPAEPARPDGVAAKDGAASGSSKSRRTSNRKKAAVIVDDNDVTIDKPAPGAGPSDETRREPSVVVAKGPDMELPSMQAIPAVVTVARSGPAVAPVVAKPAPPAPIAPKPAPPPPSDPFVGKTLNNKFLVETKLGQGGFGAVYKGRQLVVGRDVALKVLHPETARDPNLVARFRREGAVACNLRDAHTITTYDFDQTADGTLYIAMELLKGKSLHDLFYDEAPLQWLRVVKILEQMCSSLGEAHSQGIVHRDIKPENIYLEERAGHHDYVKILDFGIAKIIRGDIGGGQSGPQLTATGQTLGTLEYMSPEQLMGKQLDGRSDIYAMGVVAYEMIVGHLPFPDANGPAELISAQLKKTPPMPSVALPSAESPHSVDQVLLRMLEKDRNKRYADVSILRADLEKIIEGLPLSPASGGAASVPAAATTTGPQTRPAPSPAAQPASSAVPRPVRDTEITDLTKRAPGPPWMWILVGAGVTVATLLVIWFLVLKH